MSSRTLIVCREPPVMRVQINRPDANNSINTQLVSDLTALLAEAEQQEMRVLVLEGLPDVFCNGNDFDALVNAGLDQLSREADVRAFFDLLVTLGNSQLVTVAVVRGLANAGGVGIAAACDLVLADSNATFALSELLFGLVPACVLPFIGNRVGNHRARLMALTTLPVDAQQAADWGLVDECSDDVERLLRLRLSRLVCLNAEAVARLKNYTGRLASMSDEIRELAVGTITPLINNPSIREDIRRFVHEGVYPWQTRTSESLD